MPRASWRSLACNATRRQTRLRANHSTCRCLRCWGMMAKTQEALTTFSRTPVVNLSFSTAWERACTAGWHLDLALQTSGISFHSYSNRTYALHFTLLSTFACTHNSFPFSLGLREANLQYWIENIQFVKALVLEKLNSYSTHQSQSELSQAMRKTTTCARLGVRLPRPRAGLARPIGPNLRQLKNKAAKAGWAQAVVAHGPEIAGAAAVCSFASWQALWCLGVELAASLASSGSGKLRLQPATDPVHLRKQGRSPSGNSRKSCWATFVSFVGHVCGVRSRKFPTPATPYCTAESLTRRDGRHPAIHFNIRDMLQFR